MAEYEFRVMWLDEMGKERFTLHENERSRDTKMQALADEGYSPVYRAIGDGWDGQLPDLDADEL